MLRYRRYRVFLLFTVVAIIAFVQLRGTQEWETAKNYAPDALRHPWGQNPVDGTKPNPDQRPGVIVVETKRPDLHIPAADTPFDRLPAPTYSHINRPTQKPRPTQRPHKTAPTKINPTPDQDGIPTHHYNLDFNPADIPVEHGEGRLEPVIPPANDQVPIIHWRKQKEHFPVPEGSTIQLPTGTPTSIPKIQHTFTEESEVAKADREQKQAAVKEAFLHSWNGYRQFAWLKDELSPVSNGSRDPFCGWAATLVDSLDTLWIMGLKEEFQEAVNAVANIDFTTSIRFDIPIFEATIRYLGGLLAAYDISGRDQKILLDKAVEIGDIMFGAFDTPNRMPVTFYTWKPTFASQPHRASTRVVLAEIGSLTMEFTRLAQLTKEPKYFDAVQRVTDALEEFQGKTRLPGMWPTYLDASGCKRPSHSTDPTIPVALPNTEAYIRDESSSGNPVDATTLEQDVPIKGKIQGWDDNHSSNSSSKTKRQLESEPLTDLDAAAEKKLECIPQGLVSSSDYGSEQFTLGGLSDSTYEYLPKEWLLLGGLKDQYKTMYETSADVFSKKLFFRPMTKDNRDILVSGKLSLSPITTTESTEIVMDEDFEAESAHLTCFAGGMLAMGAKIFGREEDLEVAAKLTDGCVWAYESTATGIMPEALIAIKCQNPASCTWNETEWYSRLDPFAESRMRAYNEQIAAIKEQQAAAAAASLEKPPTAASTAESDADAEVDRIIFDQRETPAVSPKMAKRQLDGVSTEGPVKKEKLGPREDADYNPYPDPPPTLEEYAKSRIEDERLPEGFLSIVDRKYILRPEAIESVFYMYRITGDQHWREVGWKMFNAIMSKTRAPYGNSAIDDVTKSIPQQLDEMESFWLAETLKYFYLLFSDEDLVNLDEWVLNTEAHPFRRPTAEA
ncbi:glycoside hydrolase family 47 protein [Patellaria atrata CBS 101060]|uniref:alpha-1,2-Mannosidase n=1 Tax=Patellaria atrata CBS 101060 TaxID=1346257 RepID=A0A9P4S9Z3_9PEZI|nr:glycoside hydrolase family 47 protein [Patellaria atrata CBS 101060]